MPTLSDDLATPVTLRRNPIVGATELRALDRRFHDAPARDIIEWAIDRFGRRIVLAASFADTLLIDLAVQVDPDVEVVFLDTGFHFAETLQTVRRAMDRYALRLTVVRPDPDAADVWADGTDACCGDRKVEPLDRFLRTHADAWMSGLRRADAPGRADTPTVTVDRRGLVKVNPIASWNDEQVDRYVATHDVIVNPLAAQGYASIGCWPCTEPAAQGRDGRWRGSSKTECGLHLERR